MTKQELETRVAELEVKLAAAEAKAAPQPAPVVLSVDASVEAAKQAGEDGAKALREKVTELEAEKTELTEEVESLSRALSDLNDGCLEQEVEIKALKDAAASAKPATAADEVLLNGVSHKIVKTERVADLCEQWKKRFVDDNDLVVLVKKN